MLILSLVPQWLSTAVKGPAVLLIPFLCEYWNEPGPLKEVVPSLFEDARNAEYLSAASNVGWMAKERTSVGTTLPTVQSTKGKLLEQKMRYGETTADLCVLERKREGRAQQNGKPQGRATRPLREFNMEEGKKNVVNMSCASSRRSGAVGGKRNNLKLKLRQTDPGKSLLPSQSLRLGNAGRA